MAKEKKQESRLDSLAEVLKKVDNILANSKKSCDSLQSKQALELADLRHIDYDDKEQVRKLEDVLEWFGYWKGRAEGIEEARTLLGSQILDWRAKS